MNPTALETGASDRSRTCNLLIRSQSNTCQPVSQADSGGSSEHKNDESSLPQSAPVTTPLTTALTTELNLTCAVCGHKWTPVASGKDTPEKLIRKTLQAAKVNNSGPFCELCRYLIMAHRVAQARGLSLQLAVETRRFLFL